MNVGEKRFFVVGVLTLFANAVGFGDGNRNTPEGAAAVGAFGGHRVFADDANATIHNSANLVNLAQPMLQFNATFGYGDSEFSSAFGADKTENPSYFIPGFSVAAPFADGKYAVGFSSYVPYGRSVQWGSSGLLAQLGAPFEGSMTVADLTPNVAMRLNDRFSVGIGADLYYGVVNQKQYIGPGMLADINADGEALGWNAAATWNITDRQHLVATYRSPVKIEYEGDLGVTGLPSSDINADIEYPTIAALAYGVELSDQFRVEMDAEWLEFSQYEMLTLVNPSGALGISTIPQRLKDTWTVGVGAEWDCSECWTVRSGFMYLKNPTPDGTYGPLGPDEDQGVISIGIGYEKGNHLFDVGYAVGLFNGRSVTSSINSPPGKYDFAVNLLSVSYGYKF